MGYIHGDRAQFPFKTLRFSAPYNLTLTGLNTNSLKLNWEYDHSFETGFIIERSTDGFVYTESGRTSSHSFTDNNLDTAFNYSYHVAAYSHYNKSNYSEDIEALFTNQAKQIHKFLIPYVISWATLSDDASIIAFGCTASNEASILIYDTFTGQHTITLSSPDSSSGILSRITISPDNRLLAAAGDDRYITVWEISSGTVVNRIYNVEYPHVVKFSPGGKYLIVEKRGSLRFYDVQSWQDQTRITTSHYITYMDIDRDETIIATGDGQTNVKLWDFNTGILLREIPQSINAYPLEFNRTGTKLYSVINTELFAWDVNTATIVLNISDFQRRNCIAINEEENIAVSSYGYPGMGVWELDSGNFIQELPLGIEELFFSPDNYLIGRGLYPSYYIWELSKKWVTPIQ
jgi:WD40 repeat protein